MAVGAEERGSQRGQRRGNAARSAITPANVLSIARRGVFIVLGSGALLADASGSLVGLAAATGTKYLRAARGWRTPIAHARRDRKR